MIEISPHEAFDELMPTIIKAIGNTMKKWDIRPEDKGNIKTALFGHSFGIIKEKIIPRFDPEKDKGNGLKGFAYCVLTRRLVNSLVEELKILYWSTPKKDDASQLDTADNSNIDDINKSIIRDKQKQSSAALLRLDDDSHLDISNPKGIDDINKNILLSFAESTVANCIKKLNDIKKEVVIFGLYYNNKTFDDLAVELSLKRSGIEAIHKRALPYVGRCLRNKLSTTQIIELIGE